jgi:hypothetical protein
MKLLTKLRFRTLGLSEIFCTSRDKVNFLAKTFRLLTFRTHFDLEKRWRKKSLSELRQHLSQKCNVLHKKEDCETSLTEVAEIFFTSDTTSEFTTTTPAL